MDIELNKFEQLKATGEMPSPKGAALVIVRLAQRDDVSTSQLVHAIKSDPAFVGRLLKTANIIGRDSGRPIASVPDAVNVLGVAVVRNLALGFSLVSGHRAGACANFDYGAFWTRAIINALAFQAIVLRCNWANPEEAFCCGLLAEIGKLALATVHPGEYSRLLGELAAADLARTDYESSLRAREIEAFALHHDDLTAAMLTDWGFPKALVEPLYFRRSPEPGSFATDSRGELLMRAAQLADVVSDLCMAAPEARQACLATLTERASLLKLEPESLEGIVDGVVRDWREWAVLLQLDNPEPKPAFAELLQLEPGFSAGEGSPPAMALRVLLVDDDEPQRKALQEVLRSLGYQVFVAANGQQGLDLALSVEPHVLVAARQMREFDGIQLTRALRDTRLGRAIYILLLTSVDAEASLVEAFEAGVDDYLIQPVHEKVLVARLRAARRIVALHEEAQHEHEEMKHFAAELAVSNRRLHDASVTDPLTGFHNRRYAMARLEKDWAASGRSGRPISCMMIDLDNFKQINDRYGHDIGDKVLTGIGEVMKKSLRSHDVICRIGGDEFLVICPDTDALAVRGCAERLLAAAERMAIDTPQGVIRCALSIGVATRSANMVNTGMLIKAADEGMYQAKLGGRARIGERRD